MPIRHQLRNHDTVENLSNIYFGSPDRWRDIVEYNNLIYPYISPRFDDRFLVYADGFVKVTRTLTNQPTTIEKYWTLKTRKNVLSSAIKTYQVMSPVTLEVGQTEAYVHVRSLVPGIQGNTAEGTISVLGEDFIKRGVLLTVTNEDPITGGKEGFIRTSGEYIHIPTEEDVTALTDYDRKFTYDEVRYFYGDDLKVVDGDLQISSSEDLATVNFVANVSQSVLLRLTTERGDNATDYSFGHEIARIIGDSALPMDAKERLIQIEVLECLQYEDRIDSTEITRIEVVPSELSCYIDLTMKVVKVGEALELTNILIGGQ